MAIINIQVQAALQWAGKQTERGRWIAECVPLGISIEADSLDELHSLMAESTHLLFRDLVADNEFDQFLRERGWTAPVTHPAAEEMDFRVPMELVVAAASNGLQHRAH